MSKAIKKQSKFKRVAFKLDVRITTASEDKIIHSFAKGLEESGIAWELYNLADRGKWDATREAILSHERILIALPQLRRGVQSYVNFYNGQRLHSALGYLTPDSVYEGRCVPDKAS